MKHDLGLTWLIPWVQHYVTSGSSLVKITMQGKHFESVQMIEAATTERHSSDLQNCLRERQEQWDMQFKQEVHFED